MKFFKSLFLIIFIFFFSFISINKVKADTIFCCVKNSEALEVTKTQYGIYAGDPAMFGYTQCYECQKTSCSDCLTNTGTTGTETNTGTNTGTTGTTETETNTGTTGTTGAETNTGTTGTTGTETNTGTTGTETNTGTNTGTVADSDAPTSLNNPLGDKVSDIPTFIGKIVEAILGFVGSLSLLMFVYGGITWMTSGGSPEKIKKGKDTLVWSAIGLMLVFFSYSILKTIIESLTK